jgi:hypothetical protein
MQKTVREGIWAAAERIAPVFCARTHAMRELGHSSILFSDGLCLSALCDWYGVDEMIEAGTGCGGSTEMLARYFGDAGPVRGITSVDLAYSAWDRWLQRLRLRRRDPFVFSSRWAQRVARQRLSPFPKVHLRHGDAMVVLPRLVRTLTARGGVRIGVFLDGPKDAAQLALAHSLLQMSPQVRFVALDDIGPIYDGGGRYARFRSSPYALFATSDRDYFDRFGWVNAGRLPPRMLGHPDHTGYGVGVLANTPAAVSAAMPGTSPAR